MKIKNIFMKPINLFIADINIAGNTSGVDRYISVLIDGLKNYPFINVFRINFRYDENLLFYKKTVNDGYVEFVIPIPQTPNNMISEEFWTDRYYANAYHVTKHLFENKNNIVFHLHTLNLIDFALYVKTYHPYCKIITHLHCIPWKGFLNGNVGRFNRLYDKIYVKNEVPPTIEMVSNHSELRSYEESDSIICVTRCAKEFLENVMGISSSKIHVISNGIFDKALSVESKKDKKEGFCFLYVGAISPSKGLVYIIDAMRILKRQGYMVSLVVAGKGSENYMKEIKSNCADLHVQFVGVMPFDELKDYYRTCDAGVIASLQEQCSYVAIEMSMFGLPLITTAVDGLDEMFTDGENALKVPASFSKVYGLSVDAGYMAEQMKRLINNVELRKKLSHNIRKLYEEKYNIDYMVEKTIEIYQK